MSRIITSVVLLMLFFVCCSTSSRLPRFYFVHIPKTGGTSLHAILENQIDLQDLYPPRRFQKADQPIAHPFVSGHFPFWFCKELDPEFEQAFKVTILRDPVDRYLSFLRYKKKNIAALRGYTLEAVHEYLQTQPPLVHDSDANKMCLFLASDPNLTGRELLENAKANLNKFDFVLFLDHFQEDVQTLCHVLGIEFDPSSLPHLNTTVHESGMSPELLAILHEHNDLDIELYEYAKNNLRGKKGSSYRFSRAKSSNGTTIDYDFSMPLYGSNWCYRENVDRFSPEYPIYRWVMDKPAKIRFSLPARKNYQMEFTAQLLTPDIFPHVLVNGVEIPVKRKNSELFSKFRCNIPEALVTGNDTEITFYSPKSYKYNEIYPGYSDDRKLSFAMNSIKIYKKSSADAR